MHSFERHIVERHVAVLFGERRPSGGGPHKIYARRTVRVAIKFHVTVHRDCVGVIKFVEGLSGQTGERARRRVFLSRYKIQQVVIELGDSRMFVE